MKRSSDPGSVGCPTDVMLDMTSSEPGLRTERVGRSTSALRPRCGPRVRAHTRSPNECAQEVCFRALARKRVRTSEHVSASACVRQRLLASARSRALALACECAPAPRSFSRDPLARSLAQQRSHKGGVLVRLLRQVGVAAGVGHRQNEFPLRGGNGRSGRRVVARRSACRARASACAGARCARSPGRTCPTRGPGCCRHCRRRRRRRPAQQRAQPPAQANMRASFFLQRLWRRFRP